MSTPLYILDSEPTIKPPPTDPAKLLTYPRIGCSIASLVLKRTYPIRDVAKIYADCGITFTTVNLLSAEWPSMKPVHVRPFLPANADGLYDLFAWNTEHFERIQECQEWMNGYGIVVQWCLYELYGWSIRKAGPDTPDARQGPWKRNVNGVDWVGEYYPAKTAEAKAWDARMLAKVLPETWARDYLPKVVPYLKLKQNLFLVGNEFPEKSLHERVRDAVRAVEPDALVSVNRNEDTPGQYVNMKIGKPGSFDYINHHGRQLKKPSDLDEEHGGNSNFPTFRHLLKRPFISATDKNSVEQKRIVFSSDGARISDDPVHTYDWKNLYAFAKEVVGYGASFEHQSRAKLSDWPNLHMIETPFLTSLSKLL